MVFWEEKRFPTTARNKLFIIIFTSSLQRLDSHCFSCLFIWKSFFSYLLMHRDARFLTTQIPGTSYYSPLMWTLGFWKCTFYSGTQWWLLKLFFCAEPSHTHFTEELAFNPLNHCRTQIYVLLSSERSLETASSASKPCASLMVCCVLHAFQAPGLPWSILCPHTTLSKPVPVPDLQQLQANRGSTSVVAQCTRVYGGRQAGGNVGNWA